jgi:hypothetical protein
MLFALGMLMMELTERWVCCMLGVMCTEICFSLVANL